MLRRVSLHIILKSLNTYDVRSPPPSRPKSSPQSDPGESGPCGTYYVVSSLDYMMNSFKLLEPVSDRYEQRKREMPYFQ